MNRKDKMKKLIGEVRTKNPYPKDIFTEPSKAEYEKVQKLFKDAGLIQDKFFGAFGRQVWNHCLNKIEEEFLGEIEYNKIKWCGCGDELRSKEDLETGLCWICRSLGR